MSRQYKLRDHSKSKQAKAARREQNLQHSAATSQLQKKGYSGKESSRPGNKAHSQDWGK